MSLELIKCAVVMVGLCAGRTGKEISEFNNLHELLVKADFC